MHQARKQSSSRQRISNEARGSTPEPYCIHQPKTPAERHAAKVYNQEAGECTGISRTNKRATGNKQHTQYRNQALTRPQTAAEPASGDQTREISLRSFLIRTLSPLQNLALSPFQALAQFPGLLPLAAHMLHPDCGSDQRDGGS